MASDARVEAIAAGDWRARGNELLALLADPNAEVRSAAAVRIGELLGELEDGFPNRRALFEILRERDAEHPGVADTFWTTVVYAQPLDETFDWAALGGWMLAVLEARRERRQPLSPVPGNDLEFYAHERFDEDFEALMRLLDAGYTDVVASALDHSALPADQQPTLWRALFARTKDVGHAKSLAIGFGIVPEEARARWPTVFVSSVGATRVTLDYAERRLWTVHWLIFDSPLPSLATASDDALLSLLRAAGVALEPAEAALVEGAIGHVAFPMLAGTTREVRHPRPDLQLDCAVTVRGELAVLRAVRGRHPLR